MLANLKNANAPTPGFKIDKEKHQIVFKRKFTAPCAKIFEAWTKPELVSQWWDPAGVPLEACEIDLRPGGAFRFVGMHGAGAPPFTGEYQTISPPKLLVFQAMGSVGTVRLTPDDGGTDMEVFITCQTEEQLAQFVSLGVAVDTSRTLDNLLKLIESGT